MKRTGQSKIAVVGWGRGMGHEGHMYLADAVITQAQQMHADPYFFVSKTVGKDDPLFPEEKIKIYQRVFPQQATIFTAEGNLNEALTQLANLGYVGVVVVVGADQKNAFQYLEKPNKEGVPVFQSMGLQKLKVISRQETRSKFAKAEGPRATPMREILLQPDASEEQKYEVWRRDMPKALSDKEVMDLMRKAEARLLGSVKSKKLKEFIERIKPMLSTASVEQKQKIYGLLESLGAPELLKQQMPAVRQIEKELAANGYQKGTEEYTKMFNHSLSFYRKFGFNQSVSESPEEALKYATQAHAGQTRSGGDPYITHPMRVADHIKQYKQSHNLDALISAAYLHDTIEDTDTTQEVLHDLFGGLVASLVKELTSDPEQIKKMGKKHYLAHKMAAMSSYALVIKLADRLDNVKDITTAKTPEWRHKYAQETNHILDYIEKTRALSGTHNKLISLIRAKLAEIDNTDPEQGVAEAVTLDRSKNPNYSSDPATIKHRIDTAKAILSDPRSDPDSRQAASAILARHDTEGVAEAEGITRRGILKGIGAAAAAGAAGKASAIAGAFPSPSTREKWAKDAAASNAAEARRQAELQKQADAKRLQANTPDVERLNKVNYHGKNAPQPSNATWDGDSGFMDIDGTQYSMASRMPISGDEPSDMKLIVTREGRQVYIWTRYRMKGDGGHYFYPASSPNTINEFAPGNGDDGDNYAEYVVYQCDPTDEFEFIGGPLYQSDSLGMAHKYAYEHFLRYRPKAFVVYQPHKEASRGHYGVKDERGVIEAEGVAEGAPIVVMPSHKRLEKKHKPSLSRGMDPAKAQGEQDARDGKPYNNPYPFKKELGAPGNWEHNLYKASFDSVKKGVAETAQDKNSATRTKVIQFLSKKMGYDVSDLELASDSELHQMLQQVKSGNPVQENSDYLDE